MSQLAKKKARTSFGATAPPFIDYLKDILRRYPDGGQILKELIQNADDAKATEVVFIHDERSYGTKSLWTDGLGKYQGPALYAYNNAAFTGDDWEAIQRAGRSDKRNDPNKVGRFGIGFNSVYHITDVPSVFSSAHLGLLDPQEKIFGDRNGGFLWSLDDPEHQEALTFMHDQFQPFRDIVSVVSEQDWSKVIMEDQYFAGTIFRFPLRKEKSEISDNLYDSDRVVELFDSFIADAEQSLLFLKNVTSVSLIHINVHGTVNTRLKVTSSESTDVLLKSEDESVVESLTRFKLITLHSDAHRETKWLVTTCSMKEGVVENLDSLADKLKFLPQVDLALPCGENPECSKGRLSCFLPLPNNESNKTGLPVYVNACFGLTDNRREIKWQDEDQRHDEHAMWNETLMKEVLPHAYLSIIQDAIKLAQRSILPVCSVYDLWPDIAQVQHKDKWHAFVLGVLRHLFSQDVALLSLAKDERKFVTLSEAVFPCNGPTSSEMLAAIKNTLVSCGENLVTLPGPVARAISEACPYLSSLKHVTPAFLRDILHIMGVHKIPKNDKLCVLEYILSDGKYSELKGLQLLPLNDGSFRSFTDREEDTALIDSKTFPRTLLPCCKHLFIPEDLSPACIAHLNEMARKKFFKVICIDAEQVADYTWNYLPPDWKQTKTGLVPWNIGSSQHPPLEWLQEFWKFLNAHFKKLSRFTGIPLIPVCPLSAGQAVSLARLQENTTVIFQNSKHTRLPDQIAQLLSKAGGTVVRGNEWLQHVDLDSYVLSPSPRSVMKVLVNLDPQNVIKKLMLAPLKGREELKDYLSHLDSLSMSENDLLSKLPLFKTMRGGFAAAQSKQAVLLTSDLTVPTDLPMPDSVLQCATEADRRLLQLLKINPLNTAEAAHLLIDAIEKGSCRKEDTEKIMTWILQHGNVLFSQNQLLKRRCKDLSFMEANGQPKKASNFLDPRIQTFSAIFESDLFPPRQYTHTPQMLESLTDLGLLNKEADLSPQHLLYAAVLIDKMHVGSQTEAEKRSQVLLKLLDAKNLLSKLSGQQLQRLKTLKWIPCDKPGSETSQKRSFFCPDEIRHSVFKDIVGHVMPLVGNVSDKVSNKLGLKCRPPPEKVIDNLSVLTSEAQEMVDPDTDVDFKRQLHSIYRHMQDNITEFGALINRDTRWLWSHNQFVSPKDLVLNYPHDLDLSSYVGKVPDEFLPYKKLLRASGLRSLISDEEIIGILHSIQQKVEGRQQPCASSSEVKVSIEILNWLWREKKAVKDDIPVPVRLEGEQYTLKQGSAAVFCDVSKNGLKELKWSQEEIHVVHEEITKATAEWLNIQFLSTFILSPELVGIEQCGQSEPITTRIKNILKEYDEESDVFKELIQNAEDAGAEVCKFMVDFRVHKDPPESLIDPEMALCQGPCLWAFNNEQFTAEDWENIVRVGAASKETKVEKIGKFGLGFNTVYHLTDVPSILSGDHLLILDPNVTHLKKHIKQKSNPGLKLDLSKQQLFHWFHGQFGPYENIFDCNFSNQSPHEPYPGTLIKLPFRTAEEAQKSEISTAVYREHNILAFQQHLTNNSQTHLLFLKKINALTLQRLSSDASTPPKDGEIQDVLTVSKTVVRAMTVPDESCVSKQRQAEKSLLKLDGKCKDVIDSTTVSVVQITIQQSGGTQVQSWLLYNCFGTQQSFKMALQKNKDTKFSLPIGGVAVPLQNNPKSGKLSPSQTNPVGQAFCFLPLSIDTGLPVNINGTFAVTSNRKGLWESGVKNDWNKALLEDPVVTAYFTALLTLKKMSITNQLEDYCYHTFWPDRENVSDTFKPLVDAFYSNIAQNNIGPDLFSDGERWCSMDSAIFLHETIAQDEGLSELVIQLCKKYVKPPNMVVPLPLWLKNSFRKAGLEKVVQNRTWDWEKFYREVVFNNLGTIDHESRDTLLLHAIDLQVNGIDKQLISEPCIPSTDGQLQYIKKLVDPSGRAACLFDAEEGRLLGGTENDFRSPKRIKRLLELGMAGDHLPLTEITQKAGTISKTWGTDRKKAYERLRCLLELMKHRVHEEDSPQWKTLRKTEFLPALSPGDLKRTVTLRRPTDVFSDKCTLLVNMTQPVLDNSNLNVHITDQLLQILGVHLSPSPKTVLQQLEKISKQSNSTYKPMLHEIAQECYKFLNQWLSERENSTFISQRANSFPFILVGSTFINVNCVAENEQFEAKPYLHVLPPAFKRFTKLWECVGVEKNYTIRQFESVLQNLHHQYGNKPLPKSALSMCLTILMKGIYEPKEKTTADCLIPNEHRVLQPASELFYNDSPWMPVAPGITLSHKDIARPMAQHLGIKTTRHHSLQSHIAENISPFSFHFEQQEELTVRIKNIISAYPAKKDILKELLQNADDAEATEIHFVWDKRQHGKEKTFGKKWNHLQGPALCVFNNKVFSDDDLAGIQQLGEGGKHNTPGKTGKYGVGFNSVYHLTDCPSILTGDRLLCISDPNQKYIEDSGDKPLSGIGYNVPDEFKNMYMDVYKSFLPDSFPLKDGTMFRLPLRIGTMANSSKISTQGVTDTDMNQLCSAVSQDPEGLILFLKNICKIQVHEINEHSGQLTTLFAVEKSVPQESREEKDAFVKLQQEALQSNKAASPHSAIYETTISTSCERHSKWVLAEQFGSFKNTGGEDTMPEKLPQAAIAARVGLKTRIEDRGCLDFQGEAFCSLPLPGKTGLPVHINANFEVDSSRKNLWKEDGQSLKTNWNELLKQNLIAPLYADLLHYISRKIAEKKVSPALLGSFFNNSYLFFWPTVSKDVDQNWHEMIHEVYRSIKEKGLNVIPVMRRSIRTVANIPLTEYSFDWCDIAETDATKALYLTHPDHEEMNFTLEDLGMKLVPFSTKMQEVWTGFKSAGVELKDLTPSTVRTFLKEKPLHDPKQTDEALPLPITATLLKDDKIFSKLLRFCLKDLVSLNVTEDNCTLLDGLPLLLTRDKVLRLFNSQAPKLISGYDSLFFDYMDQFADYPSNRDHMAVLQRFNLVKSLTVSHAAKYLKPLIQRHLESCALDSDIGLYVPNQSMLVWLKSLWNFLTSQIKLVTASDDEQPVTFKDVRQLFADCCILPVECPRLNKKCFLQTMKDMQTVIQFALDRDISGILFKLGFMKLNTSFFSGIYDDRQIYSLLHPELMNVNDTSCVLDQLYNLDHSEFSQLSPIEKSDLLNFLHSGVSKAKDTHDYQRKFRSLPLFETIFGERVRIDGHKEVYILNTEHLKTFPDLLLLAKSNTIFLKYLENFSLSQSLNIKILTDMEFFMKFILPAAHTLRETEALQCFKLLLLLQHDYNYCKHQDTIIASMKTVKLIRSCQGSLETASYFFDDTIELYKEMLPQERFVPQRFWAEVAVENPLQARQPKELLRKLGMRYIVSNDDIINFAYELELKAKEKKSQLKELKEKSTLLFRTALDKVCDEKKNERSLLMSITNIKFIFPVTVEKELCDYHQPFAAEGSAVQIRGSLMDINPMHQELIWTSMPIIHLPVYQSKELLEMMKKAGAHDQPPPNCVTSNMRNICQSPCETDELIRCRATVFRSCYTFLQANAFDSQPLAGLPVVLVEKDKELVRPDDTCLHVPYHKDFRPYLYKVPADDLIYKEFFKKIGVKQNPSAVEYSNVLAAIYADTCDKPCLNPNQAKTVKRAVEQLFRLIRENAVKSLVKDVESLYLPAVDGKLYLSCTLHYNDTAFETKRLEEALAGDVLLLEKLSECHLGTDTYEHYQLVKLLPQSLQPKMLSQVTVEKVIEEHMQLCELETDCEFSGWFAEHLSSFPFRHGLICLIRACSGGAIKHEDANDMCEKTFGSIEIVCCKNLETKLWLKERPLEKTVSENDVFVTRREQGCIFYLKHNDGMALKVINEVIMTLTKEITHLLGNKIAPHHLPVLGQLLMCDTLQDVQKTLAKNEIHDSTESKSLLLTPPAPGTEVQQEWHDSLDMNILNNFEEGEYVAYSTDGKYMYAVIVEELPGNSGQLSRRYRVDIGGEEPIDVSCLDLYQFKREKKAKHGKTCKELELRTGAVPSHSQSSASESLPASIEEAKREIDKCLEEIWTLPAEERQKAIKRLYLRWHPDKNLDRSSLANEAFQYLLNRIEELKSGKGKTKTTGANFSGNFWDFSDFYPQWNQEANYHRRNRERFYGGGYSYNFWTSNGNVPRPNKEEAQRWCRQARCDLTAAYKDSGGGSTEWCLFKVHQAVEKSLTAAEYKRHGQPSSGSSISALATRVSLYNLHLKDLPQIVQNLKMLGVDNKKTQYPSCHPYPHIPNGQFKSENAMQALEKAAELLTAVEVYVN